MNKAWAVFQADANCAGLSRNDVFRPAWNEAKDQKMQDLSLRGNSRHVARECA